MRHKTRAQRILDWRFLVALAFLLLVTYVLVGGYLANARKDARIDALIAQGYAQDRQAEKSRDQAAREREALQHTANRLLRLYRDLSHRQALLLSYLQEQGIEVPADLGGPRPRPSPPANNERPPAAMPARPSTVPQAQPRPTPPARPRTPRATAAPPAPAPAPTPRTPAPPHPVRDLLGGLTKGLLP